MPMVGRSAFLLYASFLLWFLYVPVASAVVTSFNETLYSDVEGYSFSTIWYKKFWYDTTMHEALFNSLRLALIVSVCATAIGYLANEMARPFPRSLRIACLAMLTYPLFFPGIVQATSLALALPYFGIERSLLAVGLGQIIVCVPLAVLVLFPFGEDRQRVALEAARDLGDGPFWAFWRVTLPMRMPAISTSLAFTFVMSFNEYEMAYFLSNTSQTLPVYIWNRMELSGTNRTLMALSNIVLLGSLALIVAGRVFIEKTRADLPDDLLDGISKCLR